MTIERLRMKEALVLQALAESLSTPVTSPAVTPGCVCPSNDSGAEFSSGSSHWNTLEIQKAVEIHCSSLSLQHDTPDKHTKAIGNPTQYAMALLSRPLPDRATVQMAGPLLLQNVICSFLTMVKTHNLQVELQGVVSRLEIRKPYCCWVVAMECRIPSIKSVVAVSVSTTGTLSGTCR